MKIELVAHGVNIKPPVFSVMAKKSSEPFLNSLYPHEKQTKQLCEFAGMTHSGKESDIWLYVKSGVAPHADGYGMCLVYLAKGVGTLYVLYRGQIEEYRSVAGDVLLFNDKLTHWWMSYTPCTIMAVNVKKEKK